MSRIPGKDKPKVTKPEGGKGALGLRGTRKPMLSSNLRNRRELPEEYQGYSSIRRGAPPSMGLPSSHRKVLHKISKTQLEKSEEERKRWKEREEYKKKKEEAGEDYKIKRGEGGFKTKYTSAFADRQTGVSNGGSFPGGEGYYGGGGGGGFPGFGGGFLEIGNQKIPYNLLIIGGLILAGIYLFNEK